MVVKAENMVSNTFEHKLVLLIFDLRYDFKNVTTEIIPNVTFFQASTRYPGVPRCPAA